MAITYRTNVTAADVSDPDASAAYIHVDTITSTTTLTGKYVKFKTDTIMITCVFSSEASNTAKIIKLRPVFKDGTDMIWGDEITFGGGASTYVYETRTNCRPVAFRVTEITAGLTVSRIDIAEVN